MFDYTKIYLNVFKMWFQLETNSNIYDTHTPIEIYKIRRTHIHFSEQSDENVEYIKENWNVQSKV